MCYEIYWQIMIFNFFDNEIISLDYVFNPCWSLQTMVHYLLKTSIVFPNKISESVY